MIKNIPLTVVVLILALLVTSLFISIGYRVATGKSANDACKSFVRGESKEIWNRDEFKVFHPGDLVCAIVAPF
ncbi:MAG: hypothetical protein V1818_03735 [Candidatus Aenigmatarchaeota archaeon]